MGATSCLPAPKPVQTTKMVECLCKLLRIWLVADPRVKGYINAENGLAGGYCLLAGHTNKETSLLGWVTSNLWASLDTIVVHSCAEDANVHAFPERSMSSVLTASGTMRASIVHGARRLCPQHPRLIRTPSDMGMSTILLA